MDKDWSVDETINQIKHLLLEKDAEIVRLRDFCQDITYEAADEIEKLREQRNRLREALHKIGYGPPHEGEPLELLNEFVDMARAALKEGE